MIKATIKCIDICDHLAQHYEQKDQGDTIIEAIIDTSAEDDDRVELPELGAERYVLRSRWINRLKVVHITANEWLYLRGLKDCPPDVLDDARELTQTEGESTAATRSKK